MVGKKLHGISRYTFELVNGLLNIENIEIKLLTNNEEITKDIFGISERLSFIKMKSKFLSPLEIIELPLVLNKYKNEYIFHSPSFSCSPFIKNKSFITIHDLNHLELPQYYSKLHKYYYEYIVKPFAKKCEKIFTVSEFSRQEIKKWLKCEADKIVVTYNGIEDKFKVIHDKQIIERIKEKYNLPQDFILYIGNLKPHKNVETLVKALEHVSKDVKLIINGKINKSLKNIIHENKLENRIDFIGYIDEDDLPIIYNLAKVFIFPSLYEGFGLPPLEAMACGCPTIVSNISCLSEITGEFSVKFNPYDYKELSEKINCLIIEGKSKQSKQKADYIKKFNWKDMVNKTRVNYIEI